jgi:hypothetical protein
VKLDLVKFDLVKFDLVKFDLVKNETFGLVKNSLNLVKNANFDLVTLDIVTRSRQFFFDFPSQSGTRLL